ncbi:zinc-binding metallopeptidase [Hoylesella loescheii]|uniref:zinc-binding metallopeptidase n=1 Tax=Hoylesella loescheii TaxID=840 RepID=UPI00248ECB45|nr:putative zinc-binding metallopeptidase [Hoylesella loescheii]
MKHLHILMLFGALALTCACSNDDVSRESIFKPDVLTKTDFDKWLDKEYAKPYNIQFNYLYNDKLTDNYYNVAPADTTNSKAMARLLKHVWLDAYTDLAGEEFLRSNCFRVIQLIGSAQYDGQNKIVLGTAEGGIQITLFRLNALDPDNIYVNQTDPFADKRSLPLDLNHWYFHTMHHEFCHILNQKKSYSTEFQEVSAGKYHSTDWVNVADTLAPQEGFVTGYASSEYNEDFAELYSTYVTCTPAAWQKILDRALKVKTDASGAPIYVRDKNKNYIYLKDAKGNFIPETDARGFLKPQTDANGKIVYATDKAGKYIYLQDDKGKPIPMYSEHKKVKYRYNAEGKMVAYFESGDKWFSVINPVGNPVYQVNDAGETVYDKNGQPVPAYYKVPMLSYQKQLEADASGQEAILKKLDIMKKYFMEAWNIDLDKLRDVVTQKVSTINTLDLKNLK